MTGSITVDELNDVEFSPIVKVQGTALVEPALDQLIGVRVDRGFNVVGRVTLRFDDEDLMLTGDPVYKPGQTVEVDTKDGTVLFKGTIVGVTLEQLPGERPQFVVVADDIAYKLTLSSGSYTYLQASYVDTVATILKRAGVAKMSIARSGAAASTVHEYLLQAGSDIGYIDYIAERLGFVWYVDEDTFHFEPPNTSGPATDVTLNEQLWEFSVRASALRPTQVSVSGWDSKTTKTLVADGQTATVFKSPADLVAPFTGKPGVGVAKRGSTELPPSDQAEATATAGALLDQSLAASVTATGVGHANAKIVPGVTLNVKNAGPASGKYLVTETQHVYDSSGYETRFVAGSLRPDGLVDMLGRPAADPGFSMPGLVIGVVTDNNDPDKLGRVKVKYVSLPESDIESTWARVLNAGGGKNRGIVFLPEIQDEVLVGFEGNDMRHPVVLGALFSSTNTLPQSAKILNTGSRKVDYRRITSRLNHVVELADGEAPSGQHILLKLGAEEDHSLRLGADEMTITMPSGKPLTIKVGTAEFAISGSGDISLKGTNISIEAKNSLKLQGLETSVKGTESLQAQGATVEVKADMEGTVQAGMMLNLKGGLEVAINS